MDDPVKIKGNRGGTRLIINKIINNIFFCYGNRVY
jgi:hypothetical protein